MGFTVTYPGGTKDSEFQTYARLLRQSGIDLGRLPRVPEPNTRRKWLHVWPDREQAETFRARLAEETGDPSWAVEEVTSPPTNGPLGPLLVECARQSGRFTFGLHPLSRQMVRSAFSGAVGASSVNIDQRTWDEFRAGGGNFAGLVRMVLPALTGLTAQQVEDLGYAVLDTDSERTLVYQPPPIPA